MGWWNHTLFYEENVEVSKPLGPHPGGKGQGVVWGIRPGQKGTRYEGVLYHLLVAGAHNLAFVAILGVLEAQDLENKIKVFIAFATSFMMVLCVRVLLLGAGTPGILMSNVL